MAAWAVVGLLTGCQQRQQRLPQSSAKAGEVVVVGDDAGRLTRWLSQDEPGLAQPEPRFDVRRMTVEELKGNARLARAIVVVDDKDYGIGRDIHARPQVVIEAGVADSARVLRDLLAFEADNAYALLRRHTNPTMQEKVRRQFGVEMLVPEEMRASRAAKDFLWMATTGAENVRSLCVMRIPRQTRGGWAEELDRIVSRNIHGEAPSNVMRIALNTVKTSQERGMDVLTGQWEMSGDAMGGPFVASIKKTRKGHIALMAFAYAPERKKRNIMRQLRAVVLNDHITYGQ